MVNRVPKKRQAAEPDPEYTGFFDAIETGSSEVPTDDDGANPDMAAQLAELTSRVDGLMRSNEDLQRANMVLAQHQPAYVQYDEGPEDEPEALPDPILDGEGYTRGILDRVDRLVAQDIDAYRQEQTEEAEFNNAYNALWDDFVSVPEYQQWAGEPDKVEFATVKVMKRMQSRGVDIDRYTFGYRDQFFADVAEELQHQFGSPEDEEEEDDDDTDRTEGLFGAQPAPVARPRKDASDKNMPDMLSDLAEIQRKAGYY